MKKILLAALAITSPAAIFAQSAVDAYSLSQTETRGTARFMAMGGAFTALGGDLSSITQNPAGIGVYRRSEIGATLDITPSKFTTQSPSDKISRSQTKAACNNFGYIGTIRLDGALRTFSWGASYNRVASFDRVYDAYNIPTQTSLSNYIAAFTDAPENELNFGDGYNPYQDSGADWMSILAYNSFMINPDGNGYRGLYQNGTEGDAYSQVRESGYVDEYNIDFGGNVSDVVYWGIGFGITDLSYNQRAVYSESMKDAMIASEQGMVNGNAGFELRNWRSISGSGWNLKAGLIVKPVNEFRIGIAVHTPTWYSLSQSGYAEVAYSYLNPAAAGSDSNPLAGTENTDNSYYNFHINSPWRLMIGAAAVIGNQAIVSLDYERQAYNNMKVKYQDDWGNFVNDDYVNGDIKDYFKASNIIRVGAEYRVTPAFSVRAGYSYATTTTKEEADNGQLEIYTSGTNPAYTFNKDVNSISFGLGYRYQAFYIDAAYVYRNRKSTYHAYTDFQGNKAPTAELTQTSNSIILSAGFKF
ncbi:MAG: hypothetical protein Q4C34_03500 [Bacteroidales bacterium]|nr:hypothetical protein [Bacteroidales bacterium]